MTRKETIDAAVAHALERLRQNPETRYLEVIDVQLPVIERTVETAIEAVGGDVDRIGRHVFSRVYTEWVTWKPANEVHGLFAAARLTSVEAAEVLGVDRTTTFRAASSGQVRDARQEPRPGSINPPWVATEAAWRDWFKTRRSAGRPPEPPIESREWAVKRWGRRPYYMPEYIAAYDKLSAMGLEPKTFRKIARMIGTCVFHYEDMQDRRDHLTMVKNACPPGWDADYPNAGNGYTVPESAIQVGVMDTDGGRGRTALYIFPVKS